eukprot:796423-Prymnesium_polylepis.1
MSVNSTTIRSTPIWSSVDNTPLRTTIIAAEAIELAIRMNRLKSVSNTSDSTVHATWKTTSDRLPTKTIRLPRRAWIAFARTERSKVPTIGSPMISERRLAVCVEMSTVELPTKLDCDPDATPSWSL